MAAFDRDEGRTGVDASELMAGPYWRLLGMEVVAAAEGEPMVRLEVRPEHMQIMGRVHGGVLASLVDSAIAVAVHAPMPSQSAAATLDLHVQYVRPITAPCTLIARGRVLSRSRTVALAQAEVVDGADGAVYAVGSATYRLYPRPA
jgi:uncharacterized protein (TIGR00369 family)